ncbi:MAG: 7-carboxy-7-deazaguanine synthase [Polaribacter sp.]|jgi:7-carboxy-7-deazaguanine synthase
MYKVKEIYYTLQGEGAQTGRPAIFCRFTGCNLWTGLEKDRDKAICQFCDTDFWGMDGENGGKYTAASLAEKVIGLWPDKDQGQPYVVCTGGEPLLQMDEELIAAFHEVGLHIAVETNGTIKAPAGLDWICVSPKANAELLLTKGDELKVIFPQKNAEPELYDKLDFDHLFLQPMDGPQGMENTKLTLNYCLENPKWRLSLQTHKWLEIK